MADTDQLKTMISGLETKTLYGQLEPLMPEIDRKIRAGVPRAEIHKLITDQGFKISAGTFYNYLHRYRARNAAPDTPGTTGNKTPSPPAVQNGNSEKAAVVEERGAPSLSPPAAEPALEDLLSNEEAREDFTNQFMQRPPIRTRKKP